jgi:hypothetical protein
VPETGGRHVVPPQSGQVAAHREAARQQALREAAARAGRTGTPRARSAGDNGTVLAGTEADEAQPAGTRTGGRRQLAAGPGGTAIADAGDGGTGADGTGLAEAAAAAAQTRPGTADGGMRAARAAWAARPDGAGKTQPFAHPEGPSDDLRSASPRRGRVRGARHARA